MVKEDYSNTHRDIIEQCLRGNRRAQFKLYQLYNKAMFNICLRIMNSQAEAEDMLQEAFSEAFLQLHNFRYESSFGAWLKRITINKCINALKKKRIELHYSEEQLELKDDDTDDESEEMVKLSVSRILKGVSKLADGYRVIFSLYTMEGYDHSEIAQIMDISESTSKSQYLRAKRRLKEILAEM